MWKNTRARLAAALGRAAPVAGPEIELDGGHEIKGKEKVRQREARGLGDDTGRGI